MLVNDSIMKTILVMLLLVSLCVGVFSSLAKSDAAGVGSFWFY
jgi:hypothetical protein